MTPTLDEVVQFLMGAGQIDGVYFGEMPEHAKSTHWWRKHLQAAYTASVDTEFMDLKRIRKEVAKYYRTAPDALAGRGRSKGIVTARQMAYLLCRTLTPCSTPEIGDAFGRDHSTVVMGIESMKRRVNSDPIIGQQYSELKQQLEERIEQ